MLPTKTLVKLWVLAVAAWGHRWVSAHGELPVDDNGTLTTAGRLWATGLRDVLDADVLAAVEYFAARNEWPPALAELRKRGLGIPALAELRADLVARELGFTRLLFTCLDGYAFARADGKKADRMLAEAYERATDKRLAGEPFPPRMKALTRQKPAPRKSDDPVERHRIAQAAREALGIDAQPVVPAVELSPHERIEQLRADAIGSGLDPAVLKLEVTVDTWEALKLADKSLSYVKFGSAADDVRVGGFPVSVVKAIPLGKPMRLVRA